MTPAAYSEVLEPFLPSFVHIVFLGVLSPFSFSCPSELEGEEHKSWRSLRGPAVSSANVNPCRPTPLRFRSEFLNTLVLPHTNANKNKLRVLQEREPFETSIGKEPGDATKDPRVAFKSFYRTISPIEGRGWPLEAKLIK